MSRGEPPLTSSLPYQGPRRLATGNFCSLTSSCKASCTFHLSLIRRPRLLGNIISASPVKFHSIPSFSISPGPKTPPSVLEFLLSHSKLQSLRISHLTVIRRPRLLGYTYLLHSEMFILLRADEASGISSFFMNIVLLRFSCKPKFPHSWSMSPLLGSFPACSPLRTSNEGHISRCSDTPMRNERIEPRSVLSKTNTVLAVLRLPPLE
ncbi:uncharacterized protein LOC129403386 [Sorex araneus]|uniref:uncharacterized protein LOC129403386 n=1 Tax=Sorex araneus TaxID=42254 RepID=UPI002433D4FA|nr:uncharacterized protein LOC129403386 [Sorex araneus]